MDAIFTEPTRCSNTNTGAKIKFKRGIIGQKHISNTFPL